MFKSGHTEEFQSQLSENLRRLRNARNVTGRQLASLVNISQSKVSRFETGQAIPTQNELEAIMKALNADKRTRSDLLVQRHELAARTSTFQDVKRHASVKTQIDAAQLEATSSSIDTYTPVAVAELLQTSRYYEHLVSNMAAFKSSNHQIAVVHAQRQALLYDTSKQFRFLMLEAGIGLRVAPPDVMLEQLGSLEYWIGKPNVHIGIVPQDGKVSALIGAVVVLYDTRTLLYEIVGEHVIINSPSSVALVKRDFNTLWDLALIDQDALPVISRMREAFEVDLRQRRFSVSPS